MHLDVYFVGDLTLHTLLFLKQQQQKVRMVDETGFSFERENIVLSYDYRRSTKTTNVLFIFFKKEIVWHL